jgi:lactate permease
MSFLLPAGAIAPLVVVLGAILILRRAAWVSALAGLAVAGLLTVSGAFPLQEGGAVTGMQTAAILTLGVALVIVPGLWLNEVLRKQGIVDGIAKRVEALPFARERIALVLLLGLVPAVEALTGFGVSLFLAVPVLFRLFDPARAHRLSLLGMNIMPWGTLALATIVGAALSGEEVRALGTATSLTSALVFPIVGLSALVTLGGAAALRRDGGFAAALGFLLAAFLYANNRWLFVETAGVVAGIATASVGIVWCRFARSPRGEHGRAPGAPGPGTPGLGAPGPGTSEPGIFRLALPYVLVMVLIGSSRAVGPVWDWLGDALVLETDRIRFAVLTSPGVALAAAAAAMQALRPVPVSPAVVLGRARLPVLGVFAFLVLAQLMRETGMIDTIAQALVAFHGPVLYAIVPALGMVAGFATASNVGGNALLMPMQHDIGLAAGSPLLFAAAQNSAAGHVVFTSLPIILLVLAIARDTAGAASAREDELLRFSLKVAVAVFAAIVAALALLDGTGLAAALLPA